MALSNAQTTAGVDDVGLHLLKPQAPLLDESAFPPAKERKEIAVDSKLFDKYVGRYELRPNFILTITREGDRLFGQATGQSKVELFAEGEKDYFLKVVDAQITFEVDAAGTANQLVLHQFGRNGIARRIE